MEIHSFMAVIILHLLQTAQNNNKKETLKLHSVNRKSSMQVWLRDIQQSHT